MNIFAGKDVAFPNFSVSKGEKAGDIFSVDGHPKSMLFSFVSLSLAVICYIENEFQISDEGC